MIDYATIADAVIEGETYQTAFDRLSALTQSADKNIDTKLIKQYLILVDKWLPIKTSAEPAAMVTVEALDTFDTFDITNAATGAMVKAKLDSMMDALITAGLIDATDKTAIMAMGSEDKPVWEGLTFSHVCSAMDKRALGEV